MSITIKTYFERASLDIWREHLQIELKKPMTGYNLPKSFTEGHKGLIVSMIRELTEAARVYDQRYGDPVEEASEDVAEIDVQTETPTIEQALDETNANEYNDDGTPAVNGKRRKKRLDVA